MPATRSIPRESAFDRPQPPPSFQSPSDLNSFCPTGAVIGAVELSPIEFLNLSGRYTYTTHPIGMTSTGMSITTIPHPGRKAFTYLLTCASSSTSAAPPLLALRQAACKVAVCASKDPSPFALNTASLQESKVMGVALPLSDSFVGSHVPSTVHPQVPAATSTVQSP